MLKIALSKKAFKFVKDLPPKQFRQVVGAVLSLTQNPKPHDSKPLKGYPYHRQDVGEYRVIYYVDGDTLKIPIIGKRNDDDVYRQLS